MDHRIFGVDRRIVVLGLARMADALGNSFLIVVLPLYITSQAVTGATFGLPVASITGIVLALFGLVNSFVQPFAGRLSDRAGKRKLFVLLGLVVLAAANAVYTLAGSYVALILIRAAQGAAVAFTITASVALVNELSAGGGRGGNMGVYNSFRLIGFGGGPLLAGVVIEGGPYALPVVGTLSGFDAAFYLAALAALLSVALVALFVNDPEETRPTNERLALHLRSEDPDLVLDPIFTLGLTTLLMTFCIALLSPIETLVNTRFDQGPVMFAVQFATFVGALALAQPIIGRASDRYGRRGFILLGMIALIPTTLAQGLVTTSLGLIAARFLQGIAGAFVLAPALALAGDLTREGQSGAQLSVLTISFGLGVSAGQLTSGFLIRFGFVVPFAVGASLAAVGASLVFTQIPTRLDLQGETAPDASPVRSNGKRSGEVPTSRGLVPPRIRS